MAERLFAMIGGVLLSAGVTFAHPYHVSVAEIERDAETNRLEVALRVWPEDLERVLSSATGERVNIERTENADELIVAYLDRVFVVAPPSDDPPRSSTPAPVFGPAGEDGERAELPRIVWVGKEIEGREAWIYFEVRLPEGMDSIEGAWISNRLHFGAVEQQENVMRVRDGEFRVTVRTDERTPWVRVVEEGAPANGSDGR
ncbi:MAG: hypothetical protein RLN60_05665 [Phycisphaerales bacterium]